MLHNRAVTKLLWNTRGSLTQVEESRYGQRNPTETTPGLSPHMASNVPQNRLHVYSSPHSIKQ